MLAIFLAILKCIGIVLLVILCLILLIVAAVLFVPLRYKIAGDYRGSPEKPSGLAGVSWLFGFLKAGASYDTDGLHYSVKILSFTILSDAKKPGKQKKRAGKQKTKRKTESSASRHAGQEAARAEAFDDREKIKFEKQKQEEAETSGKKAEVRPNAFQRFLQKIKALPEKINARRIRLREKLRNFWKKLSSLRKVIEDPAYLRLAGNLYAKIRKLLHFLKPTAADIRIKYGSDDPSQTGTVAAAVAAACGLFGWQDISFTPDFEEVLTVSARIKGKIRLIHVLVIAIQVLTDKDFRRIVLHKEPNRKHRSRTAGNAVPVMESGQKG